MYILSFLSINFLTTLLASEVVVLRIKSSVNEGTCRRTE